MTRRALLLGRGVAGSLSPAMHNAAFAACGIAAVYEACDVEAAALAEAVAELRRPDCLGANVTMPHKRSVVALADTVSRAVRRCGAGNLLVRRGRRLRVDNTDVLAVRAALLLRRAQVGRGTVGVLGAGGAAAAVLEAMRDWRPPRVALLARRPAPAQALALRYRRWYGRTIEVLPLSAAATAVSGWSVVVNATPIGMRPGDPSPVAAAALHPELLVYELVYRRDGPTALQRAALAAGCPVTDGLAHLLAQALPTFTALTGREAPEAVMTRALTRAAGRPPVAWDAAGP